MNRRHFLKGTGTALLGVATAGMALGAERSAAYKVYIADIDKRANGGYTLHMFYKNGSGHVKGETKHGAYRTLNDYRANKIHRLGVTEDVFIADSL